VTDSTDFAATPATGGSTEPSGAAESNRPPDDSGSDLGRADPPPAEALIDQEQKGQAPSAEMLMDNVEFSAPNRSDAVQLTERDASE